MAKPVAATTMCEQMATIDFSDIQDAPVQVIASTPVQATKEAPSYCDVEGYVLPQVGFEIELPSSQWNGKFMEVGCAGTCGKVWLAWCAGPLRKGYACVGSDMGHKGTSTDGLWAYNNVQAELDWAYRATHVVALAGKAIAERYYGQAPNKSYFLGCSTGGRQGLIEAQRFPWDFDGIVAGAPAIDSPGGRMRQLWDLHALLDRSRNPILDSATLRLLHDAALAACDMDDGIQDGIISNPKSCRFDPSKLACNGKNASKCLTDVQVQAAKAVYAGPTTSHGVKIYAGGLEPGSELEWADLVDSFGSRIADFFKYMGFIPPPGPSWSRSEFDFDRDYKRLDLMNALYSAANPDLRRFKAAGGKMIVYHGWADKAVAPKESVDYFETVERTMGGSALTRDFFRLFMVPGMSHCTGGAGAFAVDYLSYLEKWVERGEAPERMTGAHVDDINWGEAFGLQFPLAPTNKVSFTRALYPYPMVARYKGSGDPTDYKNFKPVAPSDPLRSR
jgi:Tannase and feruloyl esterase